MQLFLICIFFFTHQKMQTMLQKDGGAFACEGGCKFKRAIKKMNNNNNKVCKRHFEPQIKGTVVVFFDLVQMKMQS